MIDFALLLVLYPIKNIKSCHAIARPLLELILFDKFSNEKDLQQYTYTAQYLGLLTKPETSCSKQRRNIKNNWWLR